SPRQDFLEQFARLIAPADRGQSLDIPETAQSEGGCRRAEIVRRLIAEQVIIAAERLTDLIHGGDESGLVRRYQPQFAQQQRTGVDMVGIEMAGIAINAWIPGAFEDGVAEVVRRFSP